MYCNQKNDCNSGCSVQRVCLRPVPAPIGATGSTGPTGSLGQNPYDLYVQASAASGGDGTQLNPNSTGTIMNNVAYNTRGYVVDRAIFVFLGNSWGIPENAVDIALLAGTVIGAPYDSLSALEASNSNATISDQR